MQIFVTGTGTDVGKTLICSWLCLHSQYDYFKPIQTGSEQGTDSDTLKKLTSVHVHPECFSMRGPFSPHLSAKLQNIQISMNDLSLPKARRLIIEGAGGLMVPINDQFLQIDLIKKWQVPVILVTSSKLGTINHTLLSLEALRARHMPILGVIVNGPLNNDNVKAIADYGQVTILGVFPELHLINPLQLLKIPLTPTLKNILEH